MGNIRAVVGKISRHSCLGYTLSAGFGIKSVATECTINPRRSTVVDFTH